MQRIFGLRNAALAATIVCGLGWANGASATVETVNLTTDHCTGGCLSGGGTATVTVDDAGGILAFDVVLTGNLVFQDSTGLDAFVFSLDKSPLAVSSLTSGFAFVSSSSGTIHEDGFGNFGYGVTYSGPRTVQELKFDVSATGGLTLSDLTQSVIPPGSDSVLFAADVFSNNLNGGTGNGNTGPIGGGTSGGGNNAPEPASMLLLGAGLIGLGAVRHYRR